MCGIAGGLLRDRPFPTAALKEALGVIRHRGPDSEGLFVSGGVGLGVRRLAVIDLETGEQPLSTEDEDVIYVGNGEVYNYLELGAELKASGHRFRTRSDLEVVGHLYEDHGTEFAQRLWGMMALALWDSRTRRLVLLRDRLGKKPLYYLRDDNGSLLFGSEIKAVKRLADALGWPLRLSQQAVYDYLSLSVVPQPDTIFHNLKAIPPASVAVLDGRSFHLQRYWSPDRASTLRPTSYGDVLKATRELIADAVRIRLRSDVPLGVFLSGGIDSAIVTYEASKLIGESLSTFTITVPGTPLDEGPLAELTARSLNVSNTSVPLHLAPSEALHRVVEHFDQPFADPSAIPSLRVAELARPAVKVVLNGDGGDEVFAGYRRYVAARYIPAIDVSALGRSAGELLGGIVPRRSSLGFLARALRGCTSDRGLRYLLWTTDLLSEQQKRRIWCGESCRSTEEAIVDRLPQRGNALSDQLSGDRQINLLSALLVKMDMASMAASVEARSPLLDHRLVELTNVISPARLIRRGRPKAILRDAYADVLPRTIIKAPKRGFEIPLDQWIDGPWSEMVQDTLGSTSALTRDFVKGRFIDGLLAGTSARSSNGSLLIYSLLVLELWLRQIENPLPSAQ